MRRVPYGTRGLKPEPSHVPPLATWSRPVRDAWIETNRSRMHRLMKMSRPVRDAWIETDPKSIDDLYLMSRPVRDAWIETEMQCQTHRFCFVASRTGRVD